VISLIVAASENNVIGVRGELPWRLPADLRRFKAITMGKPIVMGRLTWESIGRALPGRHNIVISRQEGFVAQDCTAVRSPEAAIEAAGDVPEVMVIGGGHIYAAFLPRAGRVYLTRVHQEIKGDAFFPALDAAEWTTVASEPCEADESAVPACTFLTLERRRS
jgi:dihydrofolate reductase